MAKIERRFMQPGTERMKALEAALLKPVKEWRGNDETESSLEKYDISAEALESKGTSFLIFSIHAQQVWRKCWSSQISTSRDQEYDSACIASP